MLVATALLGCDKLHPLTDKRCLEAIKKATLANSLQLVRKILDITPERSKGEAIVEAILHATDKGYTIIVKATVVVADEIYSMSEVRKRSFFLACTNGHYCIARWLYEGFREIKCKEELLIDALERTLRGRSDSKKAHMAGKFPPDARSERDTLVCFFFMKVRLLLCLMATSHHFT